MGVDGVVLAAGLSSRAGTNKLLLELDGKSIINRCLETISQVCQWVIVVGGHRFGELEAAVGSYPYVELVYNKHYSDGMFSSVLKGIQQVTAERFFLCPGDYPLIDIQTYFDLLSQEFGIIIPSFQGRSGHPVLIDSCYIPAIGNGDYSSLRCFIRANHYRQIEVSDPGIHLDVDTIADYENAGLYLSGHLELFPEPRPALT